MELGEMKSTIKTKKKIYNQLFMIKKNQYEKPKLARKKIGELNFVQMASRVQKQNIELGLN